MRAIIFLLISLFATNAIQAADKSVDLSKILSAVSDYQDTEYYRAILIQGEEEADLYIYTHNDDYELVQTVVAPGIAITGIGGADAYLFRNEDANLQLISHNPAIGRHRWTQTLTIAYREGRFVVSGYTYAYYDTIAVDENGDVKTGLCDVNLLTGKGIKDGKSFSTQMRALPVQDWRYDMGPDECVDD